MLDARKRSMAEIVLFTPKAELDAAANLSGFVDMCRSKLTVFGADLPFQNDVWDVTEAVATKDLSVNNVDWQLDLAQRNDGGREMVERQKTVLKLLVAHQQFAETVEPKNLSW